MISDEMQNILLDIVPDSDYLSAFFGDPAEDIKSEVDRAMEVILESAELDHEGWHNKHADSDHCPGHMHFVGSAMKGFLLSHGEKYNDAMVMAIISLVFLNVGAKSAEMEKSHTMKSNKPFTGPFDKGAIDNITDEEVKKRFLKAGENIVNNGEMKLTDEQFDEMMGITPDMTPREKLERVLHTIDHVPLPDDMPPELKERAKKMFEEVRNRIKNQ